MFTCVIPTLWKSPRIIDLVAELCRCPSVGEVIVIDNDPSSAMGLYINTNVHAKLKIMHMQENIFVNPAWNLGVNEAKYDDIALVNDDINFNSDVFTMFDDGRLKTLKGAVGMAIENYKLTENGELRIVQRGGIHYGWGCMILINKENYVAIPDDLLIWCGDNWMQKNMPVFTLYGLKITTEMSTTSRGFNNISHKDSSIFNTKYNKRM